MSHEALATAKVLARMYPVWSGYSTGEALLWRVAPCDVQAFWEVLGGPHEVEQGEVRGSTTSNLSSLGRKFSKESNDEGEEGDEEDEEGDEEEEEDEPLPHLTLYHLNELLAEPELIAEVSLHDLK